MLYKKSTICDGEINFCLYFYNRDSDMDTRVEKILADLNQLVDEYSFNLDMFKVTQSSMLTSQSFMIKYFSGMNL
jgi:hypothetical protein